MSDPTSCPDSAELDALISRVRTQAAVPEVSELGTEGSELPFSSRFRGIDTAIRQDIDAALLYQTPFATPAVGRMRRLKGAAKDVVRRLWSWQSTLNGSLVSAAVGLSDKTTALVLEIESLDRRVAELEARLDGPVEGGSSNSDSAS